MTQSPRRIVCYSRRPGASRCLALRQLVGGGQSVRPSAALPGWSQCRLGGLLVGVSRWSVLAAGFFTFTANIETRAAPALAPTDHARTPRPRRHRPCLASLRPPTSTPAGGRQLISPTPSDYIRRSSRLPW
jgi:hypothetical protein